MTEIREIAERLVAVLFPHRCVICQSVVAYGELLCGKCGCSTEEAGCVSGKLSGSGISGAVAAMVYDKIVSQAIYAFKQYNEPRMTVFFADRIIKTMLTTWEKADFDLIVAVPMSKRVFRQRGFNQAGKLADALGKKLNVAVRHDILKRSDTSLQQHDLNRDERVENARRSYNLTNDPAAVVKGKKILLVDDVITTGATASVCAALLLGAGAGEVWFAAIATAGKHESHSVT